MAKLNKNAVLENVFDYLQTNGFVSRERFVTGKAFCKDDKLIVIYGDTVSFRECMLNDEDIDYPEFAHCTGIEAWDLKAWKLVLHAYNIVPISFQLQINMNHTQSGEEWIGNKIERYFGNVKTMLCLIIVALTFLTSCASTHKVLLVQDFEKVNGKWIPVGTAHVVPDTVTTVHIYSIQKGKHIYAY